jgi:hypothetical protein
MYYVRRVNVYVSGTTTVNMDDNSRHACEKIMTSLLSHRISEMFIAPVDPISDECPDYFTIIKFPMDLTTVQCNLSNGLYSTVDAWRSDVNRIWSNALLYHGPTSMVSVIARELQSVFDGEVATVFAPESDRLPTFVGFL